MRHGKKIAHLGRKTAHRSYMLANMACSLIEHKSINTTVAKAKALKKYIEPLITKAKTDSTHNRRIVFSYLKNKDAVTELFRDISVKIADRPGGYTRVIKLGNRLGDNASMAMIELVDYNTIYNSNSDSSKKTRRRKKPSSKSASVIEDAVIVEDTMVVEESVVEEKNPVTETAPLVVSKEKTPVAEETNAADASNVENNESKPSIT
jgi:large subunit ribosomal protein L17|tara:strand:- start:130029 stop:130649 length:621 start_codon:yes stop_codon:yes gene_type:complete